MVSHLMIPIAMAQTETNCQKTMLELISEAIAGPNPKTALCRRLEDIYNTKTLLKALDQEYKTPLTDLVYREKSQTISNSTSNSLQKQDRNSAGVNKFQEVSVENDKRKPEIDRLRGYIVK